MYSTHLCIRLSHVLSDSVLNLKCIIIQGGMSPTVTSRHMVLIGENERNMFYGWPLWYVWASRITESLLFLVLKEHTSKCSVAAPLAVYCRVKYSKGCPNRQCEEQNDTARAEDARHRCASRPASESFVLHTHISGSSSSPLKSTLSFCSPHVVCPQEPSPHSVIKPTITTSLSFT